MPDRGKKHNNQFKENENHGEKRKGRLSQYKNHGGTEAGEEYEYLAEANVEEQMKEDND